MDNRGSMNGIGKENASLGAFPAEADVVVCGGVFFPDVKARLSIAAFYF